MKSQADTQDQASQDEFSDHIQKAVRASNLFHNEHQRQANLVTRLVQSITIALSHPISLIAFLVVTAAWIYINTRPQAFDEAPFHLFGTICGFIAVLVTLMILTTQQHENELSEKRARLTLELVILVDQKLSKSIEMLSALRSDQADSSPGSDPAAEALSKASSPESIIEDLQEHWDENEVDANPDNSRNL